MTWMLVLTASRSGFLDVVFSTALTSLLVLRGSSRGKIIGAAIALGLVVAISLAPQVFWERVGTMWDGPGASTNKVAASARQSEEERGTLLTRSLEYTLEHPMFGFNLGILGWNFLGIAEAVTIPYVAAIFVARRSVLETSVLAAALIFIWWQLASGFNKLLGQCKPYHSHPLAISLHHSV